MYLCYMGLNTFGHLFRITTFGESHGAGIGVVIDGCPSGLPLDEEFIQQELDRRKPGQSRIVTQRKESDSCIIQSGVFEGVTTGSPISMYIPNEDQKSADYEHIAHVFRPSHADYTWSAKYGTRDYRGGGRSSARETAARVAAGAIAKLLLNKHKISISAYVSQVGEISIPSDWNGSLETIEENAVRCPHPVTAENMERLILDVRKAGDTIGGKVSCVIQGCPPGLGQPVFGKLQADLAAAMMGINAAKGFEYGSGFEAIKMRGSQHNDAFYTENGLVKTRTNFSGGIQGGISNGMPITFHVAFKPVATIMQEQLTVDDSGQEAIAKGKGRHDPCVVPRAVPIVEAMAALVIADHILLMRSDKLSL
jgi:chorismate synthase